MDIKFLSDVNPWWSRKESITEDIKVKTALNKPKRFIPKFFEPGYYSLRGPRQVGKTTFLKLFILNLIEKGLDPRRILYFSCEALKDKTEIINTVRIYKEWLESLNIKDDLFVFLDEITFIRNWEHAVKFIIDQNLIKGTFVFTGSLASDIKRGVERFPGRNVKQEFFLPLTFRQYAILFGSNELKNLLDKQKIVNLDNIKEKIAELIPFITECNSLLENYLITGGFFKPIYEFFESGRINDETYENYVNWILGDLSRVNKLEVVFKGIISAVISKYGSPVSLNTIAKEQEIASHKTVASYIESLNDFLLLNILNKVDISKKRVVYRKEKKYYFIDPFLFNTFSGYSKGKYGNYIDEKNKSFVLEGVVLEHIKRFLNRKYLQIENIWFYKDRKGETDFILSRNGFIGIEVKWQEKVSEKDFVHSRIFNNGILLSKKDFGGKSVKILPLSLFLSLL